MQSSEQYNDVLKKINDMSSQATLAKIAGRFGYPDLQNAFNNADLARVSFLDMVRRLKNRFIRDYGPGGQLEWPEDK